MDWKAFLKKYGDKSFAELPLTDCDIVIFTYLSYIQLDGIVYNNEEKKELKEVAREFFRSHFKKTHNIIAVQGAIDMLKEIANYPRYESLYLYNYVYEHNNDDQQFGAIFIDYDDNRTFISFKGTDDLISGWKEDAELAYIFPVIAQAKAVKYVNKKISLFSKREYILGGHSKGGNLAEIAGMYMKKSRFKKVTKIYSLDGPGLKENEFFSNRYKRIDKIFELIVPECSLVGMLLKQKTTKTVVKSKGFGFISHNALTWLYDDKSFKIGKLSDLSQTLDRAIDDWLDQYSLKEREQFVNDLFSVMERAGVESLLDIKENVFSTIKRILQESSKLSPDHRERIMSLFKFIVSYSKQELISTNN